MKPLRSDIGIINPAGYYCSCLCHIIHRIMHCWTKVKIFGTLTYQSIMKHPRRGAIIFYACEPIDEGKGGGGVGGG